MRASQSLYCIRAYPRHLFTCHIAVSQYVAMTYLSLSRSFSSNSPQLLQILLARAGKSASDSGRLECSHDSYSHELACLGFGGVFSLVL